MAGLTAATCLASHRTQTGIDDLGTCWTFCYDCKRIVDEWTNPELQASKALELRLAAMSVGQRECFNLAD